MEKKKYNEYIISRFGGNDEIWKNGNTWSSHIRAVVDKRIGEFFDKFPTDCVSLILNAGSGGTTYSNIPLKIVDCDLMLSRLDSKNMSVCANIENLPFPDAIFSHVLCVGSVINYADPVRCIQELSRVLVKGGVLLIDYDSSKSWEFIFTNSFNKAISLINTFYNDSEDIIYVYSPKYIKSLLLSNELKIIKEYTYHNLSSLLYLFTKNEKFSGLFGSADYVSSKLPIFRSLSSSRILFIKKT